MTKNDEDKKIWNEYAKSVKQIQLVSQKNVNPRSKLKAKIPGPKISTKPEQIFRVATATLKTHHASAMKKSAKPFQELLDRTTERQLKQGHFIIEARLDLHGMTQAEAHEMLAHFMVAQVKAKRRNLLIITGKGRGGEGALRTNLINWLVALPTAKDILGLRHAAPKHGGEGAFYIILRRQKV